VNKDIHNSGNQRAMRTTGDLVLDFGQVKQTSASTRPHQVPVSLSVRPSVRLLVEIID